MLAGLGVAGNLTFYSIAIDRTSVAVAATLMYTAPTYVLIAAFLPGLRRTPASVASMVAMIEPITASLFGLLVLGETLGLSQWVGMAMIVITVTTLSVRQH